MRKGREIEEEDDDGDKVGDIEGGREGRMGEGG